MPENKVLLAGFEVFGPYPYNVAERLVGELEGGVLELSGDTRLRIIGVRLPINFGSFRAVLAEAIKSTKPKIAVGVGMDFKDFDHASLELSAHIEPRYGTDIKDVEGKVGSNDPLDELPQVIRVPHEEEIKRAVAHVAGVQLSENAGRHMCETVLRDLIRLSDDGKRFQPLFIHLPHTPELLPVSAHAEEHRNAMPLEAQKTLIEAVLRNIGAFCL